MKKYFKALIFCIFNQAVLLSSVDNAREYYKSIINTANQEEKTIMLQQLAVINVGVDPNLSASFNQTNDLENRLLNNLRDRFSGQLPIFQNIG